MGVTGVAEKFLVAQTHFRLPGEKIIAVEAALSPHEENILGLAHWQASSGIYPLVGCGVLDAEWLKPLM